MRITVSSHIKIKKNEISDELMNFIGRNLTWKNPKYESAKINASLWRYTREELPEYLYAYNNTRNFVYINRGFLKPLLFYLKKQKIKYEIKDKTISRPSNLRLDMYNIRPYQKRATQKAIARQNGVIKMPCGAGKTITLTNIIRRLQQHTLVIVHTNFIMSQWVNYFKDNYNYSPGIIQGDNVDIKPITVAMIPTLYRRELDKEFLNRWGCIVVDETHRVPAETFSSVVNKFPARYRFGTTATARRNDGLTNMIFATLGNIIYNVSASTLSKQKYLTIPTVKLITTDFRWPKKPLYQQIVKGLVTNFERNFLVVDKIHGESNRFNLVLSNRIEHLENLVSLYSQRSDNYELITGKMKKRERDNIIERMLQGELNVIFATQLADEGLDIPNLDVIHLTFPTKADGIIEQRIGRTQRFKEVKPTVYDYADINVPILYNHFQHRLNLYHNLELEVEYEEDQSA